VLRLGPASVEEYVLGVKKVLHQILEQKAPCQRRREDDTGTTTGGGEFDDEDDDHELNLFNSATECLSSLAKAFGASIETIYKQEVFPSLLKYCSKRIPATYRSIAVGSIGEIASEIQFTISPYVDQFLPLVLEGLQDEDPVLRRNAAYSTGTLLQFASTHGSKYYGSAVEMLLRQLCRGEGIGQNIDAITDNACGALARLILTEPQSIPNLSQVVAAILSCLSSQG